MEEKGLKVNLGKTKVMKCEARFGPTKKIYKGHVDFAGKALVQIVLSAINAVSGFMEGVVVYLVNCRMWLVSDVR